MRHLSMFLLFMITTELFSQSAIIRGKVSSGDKPLDLVTLQIDNEKYRKITVSDAQGRYMLNGIPAGEYRLQVRRLGYKNHSRKVILQDGQTIEVNFDLEEDRLNLEEIVVSGTRYNRDRSESPVIVNVLSPKLLRATQSFAISEGLSYQPGVRVEANCQNCGFTQVRLNGLEGAYSQILINSRAVFSALNSVYGLEQIPTNIIERIEVVRSGGSALYGSNAIAGTVNIITKEPVENTWQISSNFGFIDKHTSDNTINLNGSLVSEELTSGVTIYGLFRDKDELDVNKDGFSDITRIESNTFGAKAFFKPTEYNKITVDVSAIREYRRGGDRFDLAPHNADIAEELDHNTLIAGITVDQFSKSRKNKFSIYFSGSSTQRDSFYGGLGGGRTAEDSALAANAYGTTDDLALVAGTQLTISFNEDNILILGIENQYNHVDDQIPGYNRIVDQQVNTFGVYAQFEWKPAKRLRTLIGIRFDQAHVDGRYEVAGINTSSDFSGGVFSPRLTIMYDLSEELQFRGGYARGFRAPQAFNEDLHISSVGGEPQFVILSDGLTKETSDALTASLNYTNSFGSTQANFLIEGFYTNLNDPFTIVSTGSVLANGSIVEEQRNGEGAYVAGANFQLSLSPSQKWLFETGGTVQRSIYREPQVLFEPENGGSETEPLVAVEEFVRTPNVYGYVTANWSPLRQFNVDATGTYTGSMVVPRVVSESGFLNLIESENFFELNLKFSYTFQLMDHFSLQFNTGVQNIFNSFQDDFDTGPKRDSDFIYGPLRHRTYFFGITIGDFY